MAETTIAAPAAPTTDKPSATPAVTPAPEAAPKTATPPTKNFLDDDIDAMVAPKKETPKAAPKAPETAKPEDVPKEGEPAAPKTPEAVKAPPKGSMAEFRAAHDKLKADHDALKRDYEKVKSAKPVEDTDKPKLMQALEARDKRIKEQDEIIRYSKYEASDEFKEKYQKPYEEASAGATARAVQLKVSNPDGSERNLTDNEFWSIVRIGDENDALAAAVALFPDKPSYANFLVERRNEVLSAWRTAEKAKADFQKTASERMAKETEQETLSRTQSELRNRQQAETFEKLIQERVSSKPELHTFDEGDEAGKSKYNSWSAVSDLAFGRITPEKISMLPEGIRNELVDGKLSQEGQVKLHASMYSALPERAAALHKLGLAQARITELQEELKAYQETEPHNAGGNGREKAAGEMPSIEQEIDQLASVRK